MRAAGLRLGRGGVMSSAFDSKENLILLGIEFVAEVFKQDLIGVPSR